MNEISPPLCDRTRAGSLKRELAAWAGVPVEQVRLVRSPYRICPLGAMMAPFNRSAMLDLKKDGTKCTRCRACLRVCPLDIEEVYVEMESTNITAPECIHCYRCVEECPEKECLSVEFLGRTLAHSELTDPDEQAAKELPAVPPTEMPKPIPLKKTEPEPPAAAPAVTEEPPPAAPSAPSTEVHTTHSSALSDFA